MSEALKRRGGPASLPKRDRLVHDDGEPGKGIPRDDADKDEARRREEQRMMDRCLHTYGGYYLRKAFYDFVQVRNPSPTLVRCQTVS